MKIDDFDAQIQCEEYYGDPLIEDDDDFLPDDQEDGPIWDDEDDLLTDEQDHWFTDDGGLTADAYEWLAERDKENGFC